jgi:hypothetical protein
LEVDEVACDGEEGGEDGETVGEDEEDMEGHDHLWQISRSST